jgi:hypothetical protein
VNSYADSHSRVRLDVTAAGVALSAVALTLPFLDVAAFGGSAYVKPLALLIGIAAISFRFVTAPATIVFARDPITLYAMMFWSWALVGSAIMPWLIGVPLEMKGIHLGTRIARDLAALTGGLIFWLYVRVELRNQTTIFRVTRLMLLSFWIVLPFCIVQTLVILFNSDALRALDSALSIFGAPRGTGYGKIFGLAPEGSMLADQLITMYIPFLLASMVTNVPVLSPFAKRPRGEWAMLALAIIALVFTLSRIGFIALIAVVFCAYVLAPKVRNSQRKSLPLSGIVVIAAVFVAVLVFAGSKLSGFLSSFAGVDASIDGGIWSNVTRAGSMVAGLTMFLHHPLGVGTGAFPFLFEKYVPDWALLSPEVPALIGNDYNNLYALGVDGGDIATRLPDAKALPIRVLAEMGIPGVILLTLGWIYQVRSCWQVAKLPDTPMEQTVAFGCVLSLLVMVPLAFDVNSYIWVHWLFISAIAASLVHLRRRRRSVAYNSAQRT